MKRRSIALVLLLIFCVSLLASCGQGGTPANNNSAAPERGNAPIADGTYTAKFDTDSSMFHVNEVYKGKGTLTVKDGYMTIHVVLASKNIVNLFYGLADDAVKDGAKVIEPTVEKVKYPDGMEEEVYAFDIPVPYLDDTFDCALVGTKGKWYDHKVSVSNPEALK